MRLHLLAAATGMFLGACGGDRSTTAGYAAPKTQEPAQGSVDTPGVANDPGSGCPRCAGTYTCDLSVSPTQGGAGSETFGLDPLDGECVAVGIPVVGIQGQGTVVIGCGGTLRVGAETFGSWAYEPNGDIRLCTVIQYAQGGQPNGGPTAQSVCFDCAPASPLPTPSPPPQPRPQPGALDAG